MHALLFLLKVCHIFEGKKRKNNIEVDFVDLFLFCNFVWLNAL